jgi:hypothetical protein
MFETSESQFMMNGHLHLPTTHCFPGALPSGQGNNECESTKQQCSRPRSMDTSGATLPKSFCSLRIHPARQPLVMNSLIETCVHPHQELQMWMFILILKFDFEDISISPLLTK